MRLILDTNVWSYLGDRRELDALVRLKNECRLTIVTPPSILLEALRNPNDQARRRIVDVLRRGTDVRLLPEARLQADEFVDEARRLRPSWSLGQPRRNQLDQLERFWLRRVWTWAVSEPALARRVRDSDVEREILASWQRDLRRASEEGGVKLDPVDLFADLSRLPEPERDGWDGDQLPMWRADLAYLFWHQLIIVPRRARRTHEDTTYADWIGAFLDLRRVGADRASFNRFWWYEVEASAVVRNWLQTVVMVAQAAGRISGSNAVDAQHAAYLPDCDMLITADKRMTSVLHVVEGVSPTKIGTAVLIRAGVHSPVTEIRDKLEDREIC